MSTASTAPTTAVRTRVSLPRLLVLLAAVAGVVWAGTTAVSTTVSRAMGPGASTFAGYVDVTATPSYPFETPAGPAQSTVVLAFVVAHPEDACAPSWGGYYSLDEAEAELQLDRRIAQLRLTGGDVRVSFGGAVNDEPAVVCTDPDALAGVYREVVDRYELSAIDLDVEGPALDDAESIARRALAVARVQQEAAAGGRQLDVWLTLPVGADGLTAAGERVVSQMLAAGVDVRGVNGMTMNDGVVSAQQPVSELVLRSAEALHTQVRTLWEQAGRPLGPNAAWSRVGLTPMVGQSDVPTEQLTLADAEAINVFARDKGVGLVSMWSLNRDASCTAPLPTVLAVVQTSCSGIDQGQARFAEVLAADLPYVTVPADDAPAPAPSPSAPATPVGPVVDDPLTSPFPIWDPLGTYPGGTKIVWQKQVYQAKWWTSGVSPDQTFANPYDSPWTLLGPVLPGDRPAPLPTLPAGTYPQWDPLEQYTAGTRVQHGVVPYEAKWWSQGQEPGVPVAGGSPWVLIHMG